MMEVSLYCILTCSLLITSTNPVPTRDTGQANLDKAIDSFPASFHEDSAVNLGHLPYELFEHSHSKEDSHEKQNSHEKGKSKGNQNPLNDFWSHVAKQRKYTRWLREFNEKNNCGQSSIEPIWPNFRIIGGRTVIPGSWPWMASLLSVLVGQHWCAGTLISNQWLITSRHCFDFPLNDTKYWEVRLGKFDLTLEEETEQRYGIQKLIGHPRYNPMNFDNDIALIQLDVPVEFSEFVSPICLGSETPRVGKSECIITGWGKSSENSTQLSHLMRQVEVPLMNQQDCFDLYPDKVTGNMLCAGLFRGGQDACAGDSGGPLQCRKKEKWYLQGITSWGGASYVECGRAFQPGVYTRLARYRQWILGQIYRNSQKK